MAFGETFPTVSIGYIPRDTVAHRTITGLDGAYTPAASSTMWVENSNQRANVRFFVNLVIRGCTALADEPEINFRPYFRNGGSTGYVCSGDLQTVMRPRLKDLTSIKCQKTSNIGVAYTNYSTNVVDNSASTEATLDGLDTVANGDWVVFGGPAPFCGVALDFDAGKVNTNVVEATLEYWNGTAWTALDNVTDGTIVAATKTLSGDGQISWDIPAAWAASTINSISAYWARLSVDTALSASVGIEEVDLLMPISYGIDMEAQGDDVLLLLESQSASVTGTLAYSGSIRVGWR